MAKIIYKFDDDVSTDIIYPGRYMATVLPTETPEYAFGDLKEVNTLLNTTEEKGTFAVIGGKNFGCGSSREQAASALKGHELIIIAKNFARIFLQNAVNLGLQTITCPDIEAEMDDEISIEGNKVVNKTSGKSYDLIPLSPARQEIVDAGGLVAYTQKRLLDK